MFNLDDKFLEDLGLGDLSAHDKKQLIEDIYETLEMRVGTRLTERMSDAQLDEFEAFMKNQQDDAGALQWIKAHFPDYDQVAAEELETLVAEMQAARSSSMRKLGGASQHRQSTKGLFKQLGLEKLSDQEKLNISEDLGEVALNNVADRLDAILTPEQTQAFEEMLQTDQAQAFALLETFVPNFSVIVAEEIESLRANLLDTHAQTMKNLGY
jgi:succinate dehydrogenase flavin-adding protein (antitoxin of CptAB toxin-antitoxin module)